MIQVAKFENNTGKAPKGAGSKDGYQEFITVRGRLRKQSGFRGLDFSEILLTNRWEFICWFQVALENDLSASTRVVIENRFFTIDSYELINQKKMFYRFILNEQQQ